MIDAQVVKIAKDSPVNEMTEYTNELCNFIWFDDIVENHLYFELVQLIFKEMQIVQMTLFWPYFSSILSIIIAPSKTCCLSFIQFYDRLQFIFINSLLFQKSLNPVRVVIDKVFSQVTEFDPNVCDDSPKSLDVSFVFSFVRNCLNRELPYEIV